MSFWQNCSSLAENKQLHATTCVGAWKRELQLNWIRLSLWHCGCSKKNCLGQAEAKLGPGQGAEERKEQRQQTESSVFPVLVLDGTVWSVLQLPCTTGQHSLGPSTTLRPATRASSPPGCWPCMKEGDYAQLRARRGIFALSSSAWVYWTICSG